MKKAAPIPRTTEEVAAQRGFPPTFQGYTPRQGRYWREPGLPWMPLTDEGRLAVKDRRGQGKIWRHVWLMSDAMAPRFAAKTCVAMDPVHGPDELETGRVYILRTVDSEGLEAWRCARLVHISATHLDLAEDNGGRAQQWPLNWEAHGRWCLYEVTHYIQYPAE